METLYFSFFSAFEFVFKIECFWKIIDSGTQKKNLNRTLHHKVDEDGINKYYVGSRGDSIVSYEKLRDNVSCQRISCIQNSLDSCHGRMLIEWKRTRQSEV